MYFKGIDVTKRTADRRKTIGRVISVVFQDPATALNARMSVHDQLMDPMNVHKVGTKQEREARVKELIEMVGLPNSVLGALRAAFRRPAPARCNCPRSFPEARRDHRRQAHQRS